MYYVIAITYPNSTRTDQFRIDEQEINDFIQFLTKNVDVQRFPVLSSFLVNQFIQLLTKNVDFESYTVRTYKTDSWQEV